MRHGLPIVLAGMLFSLAGCGAEPAPVAEQPPPPNADERRLVRALNALLRGAAIDVRFPVGECTALPRPMRAELRESPQRIAAARARLARLRMPKSYDRMRTRLDEGLRLIAEANTLLLAWSERADDRETGECGQSTDNLRDSAYDEFHDLAKPREVRSHPPPGRTAPRGRRRAQGPVRHLRHADDIGRRRLLGQPPAILTSPEESSVNGRGLNWTTISSRGFPALTVPAGFTTRVYDLDQDGARGPATPAALPVGVDILALPFNEDIVFEIGTAYEAATRHRRQPPGFGPLTER